MVKTNRIHRDKPYERNLLEYIQGKESRVNWQKSFLLAVWWGILQMPYFSKIDFFLNEFFSERMYHIKHWACWKHVKIEEDNLT